MKAMKTALTILLAALLLASPALAQDNGNGGELDRFDPTAVQKVELLLRGYHGLPERDAMTSIPDAQKIVAALAQSEGRLTRDRALAAMGHFWPSGDVFLLYAKTLASPDTPEGTRHRIMILAADVFGERAVPMLKPYLQNENVQLRMTAVDALGYIRTDEVVAILENHARGERNAIVLERIDKAMRVVR